MSKFVLSHRFKCWITENSETIVKVAVFLVIFVSAMFNPEGVLAQPVMGGSVGKTVKEIILP